MITSSKCISFNSIILFIALSSTYANGATFTIRNNCPYTIWPAAVPGGGHHLDGGQTWTIEVAVETKQARIWARTGCLFDEATSLGHCGTGGCDGLLQCQGYGTPPHTLAEYSLNQFNGRDFFHISLVDGFNVPMAFRPNSGNCSWSTSCTADINGQCPMELRRGRGCNNPCSGFRTNDLFCTQYYSRFFKEMCPNAYSSPKDIDSIFSCPGGTNYEVVFCPAA